MGKTIELTEAVGYGRTRARSSVWLEPPAHTTARSSRCLGHRVCGGSNPPGPTAFVTSEYEEQSSDDRRICPGKSQRERSERPSFRGSNPPEEQSSSEPSLTALARTPGPTSLRTTVSSELADSVFEPGNGAIRSDRGSNSALSCSYLSLLFVVRKGYARSGI